MKELFKKRGYGVKIPDIWVRYKNALDNPNLEVYQCMCGEVALLSSFLVPLRMKDGVFVCKVCGEYKDQTVSGDIESRVDELVDLGSKLISLEGSEFDDVWIEIKNKAKGLFPTDYPDAFNYSIDIHQSWTSPRSMKIEKWISFMEHLGNEAKNLSFFEYKKIFSHALIKRANDRLRAFYIKKEEIAKQIGFNIWGKISSQEDCWIAEGYTSGGEERVIRMLISTYRTLLENTMPLELLANLNAIADGRTAYQDPFDEIRVGYFKKGKRKTRKLRGVADFADYITKQPRMKNVASDIRKLYDTHLRNDDAHEQFTVEVEKQVIYSTKYDERHTFTEVEDLIDSFFAFIRSSLTVWNDLLWKSFEMLSSFGVESVNFTLDLEEQEAAVNIHQYIWFKNISTDNPVSIEYENGYLIVRWGKLPIKYDPADSLAWLKNVEERREIILNVVYIAPDLAYYREPFTQPVELNNQQYLVMDIIRQEIKVDKKFDAYIENLI